MSAYLLIYFFFFLTELKDRALACCCGGEFLSASHFPFLCLTDTRHQTPSHTRARELVFTHDYIEETHAHFPAHTLARAHVLRWRPRPLLVTDRHIYIRRPGKR